MRTNFKGQLGYWGGTVASQVSRSSHFFRSMSDVMNLKKGAGIVSTLCKMGATKKLAEISIPGNSTTTTGLTKVPRVSNIFWEAENVVLCVRVGCRLCLSSGGILFFFFFFLG
jgi:hypothetical protein